MTRNPAYDGEMGVFAGYGEEPKALVVFVVSLISDNGNGPLVEIVAVTNTLLMAVGHVERVARPLGTDFGIHWDEIKTTWTYEIDGTDYYITERKVGS